MAIIKRSGFISFSLLSANSNRVFVVSHWPKLSRGFKMGSRRISLTTRLHVCRMGLRLC